MRPYVPSIEALNAAKEENEMLAAKEKAPSRQSKQSPQIVEIPTQTMAVVYTKGDPNVVGKEVLSALYGAVYTLKFSLKKRGFDFKVGALRARWPDIHGTPKGEWVGMWGLPIPEDTTSLPQKDPSVDVKIERWEYGTVGQILHIGPYSEEHPTVQRLHDFIQESGYEIAGVHEEHYLTSPNAKVQKTVILYPVKKTISLGV